MTRTFVFSNEVRYFRGKHSFHLHPEGFDSGCAKVNPPEVRPIRAVLIATLEPVYTYYNLARLYSELSTIDSDGSTAVLTDP